MFGIWRDIYSMMITTTLIYDNIDKEILQFKYEDSIRESETIVFDDCDDDLDTTQQEEGKYSIIELADNDNNKWMYYDTVYLVLLISRMLCFVPPGESLVYHVNLLWLEYRANSNVNFNMIL